MNFTGFGLNYDPHFIPYVLAPPVPFYTLPDGMVVPVDSSDLDLAAELSPAGQASSITLGQAFYAGQTPYSTQRFPSDPSSTSEGAPSSGQRPLTVPSVQRTAPKIRRPPNAFMVFANEHRKILAKAFPKENNQSISVRLGSMWKAMAPDHKNVYYQVAKEAAAEHKRLYPSYVYSPKEARMRKQAREMVRREKAVKPAGTDSPTADPGGIGCEGDIPSTETRAKLMEVAQLLDSISSDRLLQQSRRRPPFPASGGGALTAETHTSSSAAAAAAGSSAGVAPGLGTPSPAAMKMSGQQLPHDTRSNAHGTQAAQSRPLALHDSAIRGQLYHTASTAHGRDVHWTYLPHSQVSGGSVLSHSQVSGGPVLSQSQTSGGTALPLSHGTGAGGAVRGVSQYLQYGPASHGQAVYHDLSAGPASPPDPAEYVQGGACYPAGQPDPADGGSCLVRGALVRGEQPGSAQLWTTAPVAPAVTPRPGPGMIHHHRHTGNLLRHTIETPFQPALVSLGPATWPIHARSAAVSAVSSSVPRVRTAAHAPAGQPRPQDFSCLHFMGVDSCRHCRQTACCGTQPAACQCYSSAVLGYMDNATQQQQQQLEAPQLGQTAIPPGYPAQCAAAAAPRGPVVQPPPSERYRRQPVQLRIPDPRSTQALRAPPPATDLRSCWRVESATSLAGSSADMQRLGGAGGSLLWDSPTSAAYLRSTHSPNIEELIGAASTEPLSL